METLSLAGARLCGGFSRAPSLTTSGTPGKDKMVQYEFQFAIGTDNAYEVAVLEFGSSSMIGNGVIFTRSWGESARPLFMPEPAPGESRGAGSGSPLARL